MEIGYTFKRTTTCSPIQRRASLCDDKKTYVYDYGPSTEFGNLSWVGVANPVWDFDGYDVVCVTYPPTSESWYVITPNAEHCFTKEMLRPITGNEVQNLSR